MSKLKQKAAAVLGKNPSTKVKEIKEVKPATKPDKNQVDKGKGVPGR